MANLQTIAKILSILMSIAIIIGVILIYNTTKNDPCLVCEQLKGERCEQMNCTKIISGDTTMLQCIYVEINHHP